MVKILFVFLLSILSFAANATTWQITPEQSTITFTATENNAPTTGNFKSFSGDIDFDPAKLNTSKVRIVVDMDSVTTSYADVADTLKTADWFNVKIFPQAIFTANHFVKINNNTYQANGALTLRDKTLPVTLTFTLQEYSATQAKAIGSTIIKRTAFGIGQGEWKSANEVKDEVKIDFTLTAKANK